MQTDAPVIQTVSFSRLSDFDTCKFRAYLKHGMRIPEPQRPLPPGKTEHANDRGTRVHDGAEFYVRGTKPFLPEMEKFRPEYETLRRLYGEGKVSLEGEWAVDHNWETADWRSKNAWLRLKIDAMVMLDQYRAVVIDYKTGKKFGNEIKHAEQVQLYTILTFLRYPRLEEITTELWYLDVDDITSMTFTRAQALRFKSRFDSRFKAVTSCTDFPPARNVFACKWCQYGPWGSGDCQVGVR